MVEGRLDADLGNLTNRTRDVSNRQSCLQAHVRIIFNWEGKAFPCCPDIKEQHLLGDIRKETLYEIFNGKRAEMLREKLLAKSAFKDLDSCKNCSSFESYIGFKPVWGS